MKLNFNRTYDLSPVSIWIYGILLLLILFSPFILGFIYIGFPDNVTLLQATNIEPIGFLSGLLHEYQYF